MITFDNAQDLNTGGIGVQTVPVTVGVFSNLTMFALMQHGGYSGTPTFNGVSLTFHSAVGSFADLWVLPNPATGTHNFVYTSTFAGSQTRTAVTFYDTNTASLFGATGTFTHAGNSSPYICPITTLYPNSMILEVFSLNDGSASTTGLGGGQISIIPTGGAELYARWSYKLTTTPGATTVERATNDTSGGQTAYEYAFEIREFGSVIPTSSNLMIFT